MARKARIRNRIHGAIKPEVLGAFRTVRESLTLPKKFRDSACLQVLLDAYAHDAHHELDPDAVIQLLDYTPEEVAEINQALAYDHADIWALLHKGLLSAVRLLANQERRSAAIAVDDPQERKLARAGAYAHIHEVVTQLMQANDQAQHSMDVVYLSIIQISKLAHANTAIVTAYVHDHREEIDAHNQHNGIASEKHGLSHNLMRSKYLKVETEEARITFVAKYGQWYNRNGHNDLAQSGGPERSA